MWVFVRFRANERAWRHTEGGADSVWNQLELEISTAAGEVIKAATSAIATLATASAPKYATTILFPRVTAYILG